jgi:hypothetical protein
MRIGLREVLTVCAAAGLVLPALGQVSTSGVGTGRRAHQPYTAKYKITSEQTLANGATITRESAELVSVDAEGRRLTATTFMANGEVAEHSVYHVNDPVARTNITWTAPGKTADVTIMPPAPAPGQQTTGCWSTSTQTPNSTALTTVAGGLGAGSTAVTAASRNANAEITHEDLGTETILGVVAKGTRTTRTTPAGAIGNDVPLVSTTERWLVLSFGGLVAREVTEDPQSGKRTRELVELSQEAPDLATFQSPEGYEIVTREMHQIACQH